MRDVISLAASKEAALYFDRVFPNDMFYALDDDYREAAERAGGSIVRFDDRSEINVLPNLLRSKNLDNEAIERYAIYSAIILLIQYVITSSNEGKMPKEVAMAFLADRLRRLLEKRPVRFDPDDLEDIDRYLANLRRNIADEIAKMGFDGAPQWVAYPLADSFHENVGRPEENFLITVQGLELVEPAKLSWEAICAFRDDKDAQNDLRKMRVFLVENFEGKDPNYIRDKLLTLEEDHKKAAKLWGFETAQKSLSVAFTNNSVLAGSGSGLALALSGVPIAAASLSALAIPLGKAVLEFGQCILDAAKSRSDNPVKYLSRVRKLADQ